MTNRLEQLPREESWPDPGPLVIRTPSTTTRSFNGGQWLGLCGAFLLLAGVWLPVFERGVALSLWELDQDVGGWPLFAPGLIGLSVIAVVAAWRRWLLILGLAGLAAYAALARHPASQAMDVVMARADAISETAKSLPIDLNIGGKVGLTAVQTKSYRTADDMVVWQGVISGMKPATLSRIRTRSRIVIWFCTQFMRSTILW